MKIRVVRRYKRKRENVTESCTSNLKNVLREISKRSYQRRKEKYHFQRGTRQDEGKI